MKIPLFIAVVATIIIACNDNKTPPEPTTAAASPVPSAVPSAPEIPELPASVVYKTWEIGNPAYLKLITDAYQSWDSGTGDVSTFFADSVVFDLPDGVRVIPNKSAKDQLKKWRNIYAETNNIPFSVVSLHNKDLNQDWVMALTWNKWKYKDGVKDSMLYSDHWRIIDGKISHMISLQQKPSKQLANSLNTKIPK